MRFIEKPFMIVEAVWIKPLNKISRRENSNYSWKKSSDRQTDSRIIKTKHNRGISRKTQNEGALNLVENSVFHHN